MKKIRFLEVRHKNEYLKIPYVELNSGKNGPRVLVGAEQHGNEVQGCEVIRRFIPVAEKKLKRGVVYFVPFFNIPALYNRRPHIDSAPCMSYEEGENMNHTWPGKKDGTFLEKISFQIYENIAKKCDYVVDLHCWSHFWANTVLCREGYDKSIELAKATGITLIQKRKSTPDKPYPNTLGSIFNNQGKVGITIEFSGQYQINEKQVENGVCALNNIFVYLKMFPSSRRKKGNKYVILNDCKIVEIKAPSSGLFISANLVAGDFVTKGKLLGLIFNEKNLSTVKITSPVSGYLFKYRPHRQNCDVDLADTHPFVKKNELLAQIAVKKTGD